MAKEHKKTEEADLLTSPEALAEQISRSEEFVKSNKNILIGVLVGIVAVIGGVLFYQNNQTSKNAEALKALYPSEFYFNLDSTDLVLNGNDEFMGVLEVASAYSGTQAASLANYYAGVIYLKKGEYDKSVTYLKEFSADDLLVQARAYSLIGDAYSQLGKYAEAKAYYQKAVNHNPNTQFTPKYLLKSAINHEKLNDYKSAITEYEKLIKDYPKSAEVNKAKKLKARASGLSKG